MSGSRKVPAQVAETPQSKSLVEFLGEIEEPLFDMTAYRHGNSAATTSQEGTKARKPRPTLKRSHENVGGDFDNGEETEKKRKAQPKVGDEAENENCAPVMPSFTMKRWDPQHFDDFLASADVAHLEIPVQDIEVMTSMTRFTQAMQESLLRRTFKEESHMEADIDSRFEDLRPVPATVLLWRSFTEWLGGMGIIVLFLR